ncbi:MAG: sensor hybrid histidine kinase [Polaromonas sp.]|jgi:PAS domain S-box-containing protein|nr:sensor hybrid histidine kinase [Polaromonas sp.]
MADTPENDMASDHLLAPLNSRRVTDADYRLLVESVADYAIFLLDPGGVILSWNRGAQKMKGYEAGEVVGRHIAVFYPQELLDRQWPEHGLKMARETGIFEDEGWRLRKDGTRFWANIVITRIIGPHGELIGFSKITRDQSERRRQDELLRLSEERFRLLVEGVKDYAIFMLDPSGHVVSWNAGAQKNKGYEAAEIIGQHFSVFYPPEAAPGWPDEELRIALQEGRFEDEGWRIRKDGSRFWASVVITPLSDAAGRHRGFAKVTRDLTERRRVTVLEDEGRRITNFLALLGHELRNPLAPISNAVALLERENIGSKVLRDTREIIGRQLRQLNRLVDDLLDVGRITSGKIQLEARPVRFIDALHEAVEAVQPLIDRKSHVLDIHNADDPWVIGDRARLIQILSNLIGNAAKFTPAAGRISVRVAAMPDSTEVRVIDNGPGIPPQHLHKVFDLFFQGEQDTARSQGGLGLGLSLVQQLVVLHGGEVSAFSKGIHGEGSEFVVRLPAAPAPAPAPASAAGKGADPFAGRRVLVVDDNRDAAETMAMLLDALGYVPSMAHDGLAGVEAIKADAPDLVLLDIGLPGISGIEVARRVRAEMANPPPLVAITGYGQESDREASFQAGFHDHLTKPVDIDKLVALLDRLLGGAAGPSAPPPQAAPGD